MRSVERGICPIADYTCYVYSLAKILQHLLVTLNCHRLRQVTSRSRIGFVMWFPIGGQFEQTVYLAQLLRYYVSNT